MVSWIEWTNTALYAGKEQFLTSKRWHVTILRMLSHARNPQVYMEQWSLERYPKIIKVMIFTSQSFSFINPMNENSFSLHEILIDCSPKSKGCNFKFLDWLFRFSKLISRVSNMKEGFSIKWFWLIKMQTQSIFMSAKTECQLFSIYDIPLLLSWCIFQGEILPKIHRHILPSP